MARRPGGQRTPAWLWVAGGGFMAIIALVLASSVSRPEPPVFALSRLQAREVPPGLTGPDTVTLDARDGEAWTRFDLARGAVAGPGEAWDIAVKRHRFVVNGGAGFTGAGGAVRLDAQFPDVRVAPPYGYESSRVTPGGDTVHAALDDWYVYDLFSHLLEPLDATYVVRTHDGRYAKLAVLGYYCPGPEPGCFTIEYAYQGDGTRRFGT